MNEIKRDDITVDVFSHICRICLQTNDKMEDIFGIGIHNQITEFTNLKVEKNDKLPQSICSNCKTQSEEVFKFLQQAKSADDHLRSLLANTLESDYKSGDEEGEEEEEEDDDDDDERDYKRKSPRKRVRKWSKSKTNKRLKADCERDKMYLIYVPKPEESDSKPDMEILIQDLSSENAELSHYCKALVKGNLSDHTYPKEIQSKDYTPHTVNLDVFKCDECRLAFEELNDLINHVLVHDGKQPLQVGCYYYNCPVCGASERDRSEFLNHLQKHKQEGIFFVKVNSMGERVKVKDDEKHVFTVVNNCKVFLVNFTSGFCSFCCRDVERGDGFLEHLGGCASGEGSIQYTCPVCSCTFTDNEETFGRHLKAHQQNEGCFFIKVDKTGQAVELDDGDDVFVQFTEAVEVVSKTEGVFKIVDVNSCEWCGFVGDGLTKVQEHCEVVHGETMGGICCPVCMEVFSTDDNFYEHLRRHKQDGVGFVLVRKDNEMGVLREDCVDLFTQSKVLWSAASFGVSQASCIELVGKNSPEYTCDLCKKQFKKKKEVVMHLKSHQPPQECVICEKCGKECTGRGSYRKHFLQHSKGVSGTSKRPTCGICNKTFANRATLNGHIRHHMREGTGNELEVGMMCEKCGKSFSNNASLTKHKKLHMRDKENAVLKCEICDRDFFRQSSFDRHKSAHLNPKYLECDVCKMPLSSVASLQKHLESHRNGSNTFDCRACKLSFLTKDSLTAHQTHTGHYLDRKPLECNVCHEKFFIGRKFTEHIKTHPKYKMGECSLCGKRLSTIQSLMLHMGRHFESNSILCPHCGKQFFEERNYHRHLLTHEGIKPFPCDVLDCKKSFYTLFELNRHKKYHNNTRDFRCPYCSKSFHEANHLTVHVRTHTGERPYTCPHCRKGFVTRTRCKHHIKLVHQGIGYDLIQSNISKKVTVFEAVKTVI